MLRSGNETIVEHACGALWSLAVDDNNKVRYRSLAFTFDLLFNLFIDDG